MRGRKIQPRLSLGVDARMVVARVGTRPLLLAGLVMLLTVSGPKAIRADDASQEYKLKAAFIVNFARFVGWPPQAYSGDTAPVIIATVGSDPFNGALEQAVAGKSIGKRPLEVRHFDSADTIGDCQILFVPQSDKDTVDRILQRIGNKPVLTIGDDENFTAAGGVIRFFTANNKMRFEINKDVADRLKLAISSKLLALAKIYQK